MTTLPILFNGGAYGTYLEWAITAVTGSADIVDPFTRNSPVEGNSHNFQGHHLKNMAGWQCYVQSDLDFPLVRFHPKTLKDESLQQNICDILDVTQQAVLLYPGKNTKLLTINNYAQKIQKDWWGHQFENYIDVNLLYENWPVSPGTHPDLIPTWVRREFLSYYLVPAWEAQVEWYFPDHWHDQRCLLLTVDELLYTDLSITLDRIGKFFQVPFTKQPDVLAPYHRTMLSLQKNTGQDQLCNNIINSIVHNQSLDWAHQYLPLASQAYLQWELRNLGYEIECHGLDMFPTNSVYLQELLYSV